RTEARRRLLPGAVAARTVAGRRRADGRGGSRRRSDGRILVVAPGARARQARLRLARRGDRADERARARGDSRDADRGTARLADRAAPGDPAPACGRPRASVRAPASLLPEQPGLPRGDAPDRLRARRALRERRPGERLADRQRARRPLHLRDLPGLVPRVAARSLRLARDPQRELGHGVLEPDLPVLEPDPPARGRAGAAPGRVPPRVAEPEPGARLPPLRVRQLRALPAAPDRRAALADRAAAGDHDQP